MSGALLPSLNREGYKEGDRELILEGFNRDVARARRMDRRILEEDVSSAEREVLELEQQFGELERKYNVLVPAEAVIKRLTTIDALQSKNPRSKLDDAVKTEERNILYTEGRIENLRTELSNLGYFSGKKKKEITLDITTLQSTLVSLRKNLEKKKTDLQDWDDASEVIKQEGNVSSRTLEHDKQDVGRRLNQKKEWLSQLQKKLSQKN
ncbi:MAG TPA: hypothetical protein VJH21_00250 [Candidatus Paceibacterota bacterium]|uniref:Uncharacterized protein n=1 Tax=Candidatus Ryanbacteria bacterium RIFCSPHIGHO2_02_FULL_45_13b TaxID=1802117 RepID=A0A1G2G702_9BACT|nr:MAG: hypothetical protein A3J54_02210 [Candidatus Ryanbacteria bacterium RIFCSPHIGHO2_02_FULL_45_13b]